MIPHITVAAIAQQENKFLLVEEKIQGQIVLNQPAGHLQAGETLVQACQRETREEAAWDFSAEALIGIYQYLPPDTEDLYLRFAFCGSLLQEYPEQALDEGIIQTVWMTRDEIATLHERRCRSPLVLQCIDDYLSGSRHPTSLLSQV